MGCGRRAIAALWFLLLGVAPLNGATPGPDLPSADAIFASAKGVWRARNAPPFARYSLLERYTWRRRVHDNWWRAAYRDRDRKLSLVRIILPDQEAARMRGMSIGINYRIHNGAAHADSLETNADADAFPILDPLVDPDASFGLSRREAQADLAGPRPYGVIPARGRLARAGEHARFGARTSGHGRRQRPGNGEAVTRTRARRSRRPRLSHRPRRCGARAR
jgi:hypothetical protein